LRLPNGNQAIIDSDKLYKYCLDVEHDEGRHKALLFRELLGITPENAGLLLAALAKAAAVDDARRGRNDRYGQRYVVDFEFTGPAGTAVIRSAWIVPPQETVPRLVTCYIL
jgi:hypothetical protein